MDVYRIDFDFVVEHDLDPDLESELEENEEPEFDTISAWFHVLSRNIAEAMDAAVDYIDPRFDDVIDWEITGVVKEEEIKIVNIPGQDSGMLNFTCAYCKNNISLTDEMWETSKCPKCGKKINRDQLIELSGNRILMVGVEDPKDDEKKNG